MRDDKTKGYASVKGLHTTMMYRRGNGIGFNNYVSEAEIEKEEQEKRRAYENRTQDEKFRDYMDECREAEERAERERTDGW